MSVNLVPSFDDWLVKDTRVTPQMLGEGLKDLRAWAAEEGVTFGAKIEDIVHLEINHPQEFLRWVIDTGLVEGYPLVTRTMTGVHFVLESCLDCKEQDAVIVKALYLRKP